jgi:hypothetical protein
MPTSPMNRVVHYLRGAVGSGPTDGQLLDGFITRKDEAAFEALVRRYGSMVMGVCRRILRNQHDAEDAFQATFLVLVRKAGFHQVKRIGRQLAVWCRPPDRIESKDSSRQTAGKGEAGDGAARTGNCTGRLLE